MLCVTQLAGFGASGSSGTPVTDYANAGGTGDRTASITVAKGTVNNIWGNGSITNFVDGGFTNNNTDSVGDGAVAMTDGDYLEFDFGSAKYIDEVKIYVDAIGAGNGAWEFGTYIATVFTSYASFTWNSNTTTVTLTGVPSSGANVWRLRKNGTAGTAANTWYKEFEFKIAAGA